MMHTAFCAPCRFPEITICEIWAAVGRPYYTFTSACIPCAAPFSRIESPAAWGPSSPRAPASAPAVFLLFSQSHPGIIFRRRLKNMYPEENPPGTFYSMAKTRHRSVCTGHGFSFNLPESKRISRRNSSNSSSVKVCWLNFAFSANSFRWGDGFSFKSRYLRFNIRQCRSACVFDSPRRRCRFKSKHRRRYCPPIAPMAKRHHKIHRKPSPRTCAP